MLPADQEVDIRLGIAMSHVKNTFFHFSGELGARCDLAIRAEQLHYLSTPDTHFLSVLLVDLHQRIGPQTAQPRSLMEAGVNRMGDPDAGDQRKRIVLLGF